MRPSQYLAPLCLFCLVGCGSSGGTGPADTGLTDAPGATDGIPASDGPRASDGPLHVEAGSSAKRIFITHQTFQGALTAGGGLAGADAACTSAAQGAQLGGSWLAWLSTTTVDAIDRVNDVGPWYDLRGSLIFADKANLTTSPAASLWYDETGAMLASDKIWTGTGYGGTYIAALSGTSPCAEWTSAAMSDQAKVGQVGRSDGAAWTAQSNTTCDQQAHLICIEQ